MIRFFHYLQYLYFPFYILTVFYILKGSFYEFNLDDVGFGVLCMGIAFGFSSMGDMKKISKKEEKLFLNKKQYKRTTNFLVYTGIATLITTIIFISMRWVLNEQAGEKFYQLGLNCSPLIIAVFFTLKQLVDKKEYYELVRNQTTVSES